MKKLGGLFLILHLALAIYFINFALDFIEIPEFISNFESWIIFAGGVLLVLAGLHHLKPKRKRKSKEKDE